MVIEISRKSVVNYLLKDDKERLHQVLEVGWTLLYFFRKIVERASHHRCISIAQSSLHFDFKLFNWLDLIKLQHHDDCFFPNHLMGVLK